ncbi:hypothetical protein STCU_10065 [Strigomonas culicis]|uniref:Uncharacterized protein n=1 Tax=Strigomonas culicis TaxID=28005 RepID=S9TPC1_9TRYP|nr:hypothetical protein STCU_10065 [Strigomonas culicis]|eukprot:EPY18303.1 hypothetical protein STCU_10065 [Strigomonas culicis]
MTVYNEYNILSVDGATLVEGVRVSTLETSLQITVSPNFTTFPVVMAGTMHSFFGGLRGSAHIALDEPEPQLQFFYGPYHASPDFTYSWRPFTTDLKEREETYMIYVIADPAEPPPDVSLASLEMFQGSFTSPVAYFGWLLFEWPERLLSFYASRSATSGHGGSHVALFFAVFLKCGVFYRGFYKDEQELLRRMPRFTRVLSTRSTFIAYLLLLTPILEFAVGLCVSGALEQCLAPESTGLNDDQITALMSWREKLALMLLLKRPHFASCNWPWFRLQVVPSWSSFFEHMATLYFGFFLTALFYLILHVLVTVGALAWFPISRFVLRPLLWQHPRRGVAVFIVLWCIPTVVHLALPVVPRCFITCSPVCASSAPARPSRCGCGLTSACSTPWSRSRPFLRSAATTMA